VLVRELGARFNLPLSTRQYLGVPPLLREELRGKRSETSTSLLPSDADQGVLHQSAGGGRERGCAGSVTASGIASPRRRPLPSRDMSGRDSASGEGSPETWHHGLMARWWAEFTAPEESELAFYRNVVERNGEPALDLACGVGRLLLPLLEAGLDVDGADVSADMLAHARRLGEERGLFPSLLQQAMHQLESPRRYRTIYICDSFGIGGGRPEAMGALERAFHHLEPGGVIAFSHDLPYACEETEWLRWLPGRHTEAQPWPTSGDRRRMADGDELELLVRERSWDPLLQRSVLQVRGRRWHDGQVVEEDEHSIVLGAYFAQEVLLMLEVAGFVDVDIQVAYTGKPATSDDGRIVFLGRRPE
jgi:SAM-dependent methyltransferase